MLSLIVYVPESHLEIVKEALFRAGAGKIGHYDSCAWQTKGEGQFRPLSNSNPYLGKSGELEKVPEWKLELVCEPSVIHDVIRALKQAHPYETPAYLVSKPLEI